MSSRLDGRELYIFYLDIYGIQIIFTVAWASSELFRFFQDTLRKDKNVALIH